MLNVKFFQEAEKALNHISIAIKWILWMGPGHWQGSLVLLKYH